MMSPLALYEFLVRAQQNDLVTLKWEMLLDTLRLPVGISRHFRGRQQVRLRWKRACLRATAESGRLP